MFEKILCAIDGSEHSSKALDLAIDLAQRHESTLLLLNVLLSGYNAELAHFARVEGLSPSAQPEIERVVARDGVLESHSPSIPEPVPSNVLADIGDHVLKGGLHRARQGGVQDVQTVLMTGEAGQCILEVADTRAVDCIVLGSRGLSDAKGLLLGSVSHKVASRARCTCISVR